MAKDGQERADLGAKFSSGLNRDGALGPFGCPIGSSPWQDVAGNRDF